MVDQAKNVARNSRRVALECTILRLDWSSNLFGRANSGQ